MKKIFLLLIILVLTACDNPFKKYEESFDALSAAIKMKTEADKIQDIIKDITVSGTVTPDNLTTAQINTMISSLEVINNNLDSPQVQAILASYAEEYSVDLNSAIEKIKTDLGAVTLDDIDRDGDGSTANETEVLNLITAILGKI